MNWKRSVLLAASVGLVIAGIVNAGSIKTWGTETLRASDLNSNFAHIHNTMVGGHGARLVDADVSAAAAIAHTKMATPALLPKVWAFVGPTSCTSTPCTVAATSGVSSITRTSAGLYVVNFATRSNAVYGTLVTPSTNDRFCTAGTLTTTSVTIRCIAFDSGVAWGAAAYALSDVAFTVFIMDNDN